MVTVIARRNRRTKLEENHDFKEHTVYNIFFSHVVGQDRSCVLLLSDNYHAILFLERITFGIFHPRD